MSQQPTPEVMGVDGGKVVIDSYSGEAMDPRFTHIWRGYCVGRAELEDAQQQMTVMGISWAGIDIRDLDDDAPFVWRSLTPAENDWSNAEYDRVQPWRTT